MFDRFRSYFQQPYPGRDDWRKSLTTAGIFGFFVAFFLFFFQPFGLHGGQRAAVFIISLSFGAVTFGVIIAAASLPRIFPGVFCETRWTLGKELLWGAFNFWLVGSANYAYLIYKFHIDGVYGYWRMLGATVLVGFFPYAFLLLINHARMLRTSLAEANALNDHLDHSQANAELLAGTSTLKGENEGEEIDFQTTDFVCARAAGNYVEVYIMMEGQVQKKLLRSTLSSIEAQLSDHDLLFRCHRTCIVNLERVEHVTGNSQGYRLQLQAIGEELPVARSKGNEFKQLINASRT